MNEKLEKLNRQKTAAEKKLNGLRPPLTSSPVSAVW